MKQSKSPVDFYWASAPLSDIGNLLVAKTTDYYLYLQQSGFLYLYQQSFNTFYGPGLNGAQINFTGEQGQLVTISVNDYRNLLKHLHTLITSSLPSFQCRATNTDHKSQAQCILGQGLVDYYLREKKLRMFLNQATELALLYGEGFVSVLWNAADGQEYGVDPNTGATIRQGELSYKSIGPMECVRDFTRVNSTDHIWIEQVDWVNKWDTAAQFPEFRDDIISLTPMPEIFGGIDTFDTFRQVMFSTFETDLIPQFTFFHKPTPALPKGRITKFLSDGTVLEDGPMPYGQDLPIYRVACSEWLGTPFGYTTGYDLLPVQQMTDALHSTACTNANAFGVTNLWTQTEDIPQPSALAGGLRVLQSKVKPEVLELLQTSPEVFNYIQGLGQAKETLSGINAVSRGNPERDMSGSAMALLQATAIQFSMDLQQSYAGLLEDCGTATLNRLRTFASVPRVAAIAGKSNKQYMKEFTSDDISEVNRVLVDIGNPVMNTIAGKTEVAKDLLNAGLIKDPEQYLTVYTTGRLEPLFERQQKQLMLIREENELLSEGQMQSVLMTDDHPLHIKEHSAVGDSPDSRNDPTIMQAYVAHLQEHMNIYRTMDPLMASMLGFAPPPPLAMPGAVPPPMQNPDQAANANPPTKSMNPENPVTAQAAEVNQPNMPDLPPGTPAQTVSASQTVQ